MGLGVSISQGQEQPHVGLAFLASRHLPSRRAQGLASTSLCQVPPTSSEYRGPK